MQKKLLQLCLLTSIWLRIHEQEPPADDTGIDVLFNEHCSKLRLSPKLAAIPDKDSIFTEIRAEVNALCTGKGVDATFFAQMSELTQGWDEATFNDFAVTFGALVMEDGKVSPQEKECMAMLAGHMGRSQDFLLAHIDDSEQPPETDATQNKKFHKPTTVWRIASVASFLFALSLLVGVILGAAQYFKAGADVDVQATLEGLKKTNKLVIKQIQFSKYLIAGTPQGTNTLLDKLNIFLVSGSADIQFSLSDIEIGDATSPATHKLELLVPNFFPQVVVEIDPERTYLAKTVAPEAVRGKMAETVAKGAGIVGGAAGSVVSAKLGSVLGSSMGGPIGKFVGGFLGAAGGGAAAGYQTYVATKNFLTGLKLATNSTGDQEQLLNAALPLIRLELMGAGFFEKEKWENSLREYYRGELEMRLRQILQTLGWAEVNIREKP